LGNTASSQGQRPITPVESIDLYCDGACRGNPGPAAVGVVFVDHASGTVLSQDGKPVGETTNNVAEYKAIIWGLELAAQLKATTVRVYSDSEVVIRQLTGEYKVKEDHLQELLDDVRVFAESFDRVFYKEVPREHPMIQLADQEANKAFDG
jgi:ribonuclease HI